MADDQGPGTAPPPPQDQAALLARIHPARVGLEHTIEQLSEAQLTVPRDQAGWSAKDHLAHLVVWEQKTLAQLEDRPPHEVFGLDRARYEATDVEGLNALARRRDQDRPLPEVLAAFRRSHEQLIAALAGPAGAALFGPTRRADADALLASVAGNTYEHYPEHTTWIRELIAAQEGEGTDPA